jgi:hypothetical protein
MGLLQQLRWRRTMSRDLESPVWQRVDTMLFHMISRRFLLPIVAVAVLLPLLIPLRVLVAPGWRLTLTDEAGKPMGQIAVTETWQHYSLEDQSHGETRITDGTGTVVFPDRVIHSPLIWRFKGCVRQFGRYLFHASCGPYPWLGVQYPKGYGQNDVLEFMQAELQWSGGGPSRVTKTVVVHKCKSGGTGLTCS